MVGGIFYSQLRQLDIQTKVKTAEITCNQHFSSRFQPDKDCRRCLANGLNISGAAYSEVKMKNIFMSCSMVDVSSDGDLNFPRVEKCKWCKSSWLHLGSAGMAGDSGRQIQSVDEHHLGSINHLQHVPIENGFDLIALITPSSMLFVRERERNVRGLFWTILTLIMMIRMVISGLSVLVSQNRGCSGVVSSSR